MKSFLFAAVPLAVALGGCTTVDIVKDKPAKTFYSTKTPDEMRDCVLEQGFKSDLGMLKVTPYKGGSMIMLDLGMTGPYISFVLIIKPNEKGSQVDVMLDRNGMGAEGLSERYTKGCMS